MLDLFDKGITIRQKLPDGFQPESAVIGRKARPKIGLTPRAEK